MLAFAATTTAHVRGTSVSRFLSFMRSSFKEEKFYNSSMFLKTGDLPAFSEKLGNQFCLLVCAEDIDSWKEKLEERGYETLICSVSPLSAVDHPGLLKDRISVVVRPSGVANQAKCQALHDDGEGKAGGKCQYWKLFICKLLAYWGAMFCNWQ
ncbi:unnamed protein product [Sphagnum troendelagicum]